MRKVKKLLALLLSSVLCLSLWGCMADPTVETPTPGNTTPSAVSTPAPTNAPSPFLNAGMRIALCTSPETIDDQGRNLACYTGILNFMVSRNIIDSVTPLQEFSGNADNALQFLGDVSANYDVLVCVGPAYSKAAQAARANPDKYYIAIDAAPEGEAPNLCAVNFAEEQCGFFAGIVAAMETKTGRVAVINSLPTAANTRYYYGFRSGVAYTNGNFGTTAEVVDLPEYVGISSNGTVLGGNFIGSATDQPACRALVNSLIDLGCDVFLEAADTAGMGVYSAAKEHENVWVIGSEVDRFPQGENKGTNIVLTSVTKNLSLETEARLNSIVNGTFQPGNIRLTAADNALGYVSSSDHQQLNDKTLGILSAAWPMMQDGTIVPGTGPR